MADWQDISTAPKDGTRVLMMRRTNTEKFPKLPAVQWVRSGSWRKHWQDGSRAAWRMDASNYGLEHIPLVPTHWQALPE